VRRRDLLGRLAGASVVWPLGAGAQQKQPVIGFLSGTSAQRYAPFFAAFHAALAEGGFVEGKNIAIEYRWAEGAFDRLPAMAEDLVRRRVDVIVTSGGSVAALAAKNATDAIPTVFLAGDDPVAVGLVASLARPSGNRTGISFLVVQLNLKRLELLSELVPQAQTIGLLINPTNPTAAGRIVAQIEAAASRKKIALPVLRASSDSEIDAALAAFAAQHVDALLIGNDPFFNAERERFIALAVRYRIPVSYEAAEAVRAGGLISYGASFPAIYRQLGLYTAKVLKGAKPAELPVEQPTKFELAINLKTATALGLTVPQSLLAGAGEVIE
jgi:putative ABC transport system substrate-binding protein